ncbi:MAG: sensor histidine kinase, partial [Desulfobacteraceae bacterium]
LGQVLTALRIDAVGIAGHLGPRDKKGALRADRICSLIDATIEDVRDMAFRLRPGVLDDLGLVDALESLAGDAEKRSNISCVFTHNSVNHVEEMLATALYRIAQETITNALRHAEASVIEVDLKKTGNRLVLTIEDNGCGFSPAASKGQSGFGLAGMEERAILAGGELDITATPGKGTRVRCTIFQRSGQ